jgi:hypothetical protein
MTPPDRRHGYVRSVLGDAGAAAGWPPLPKQLLSTRCSSPTYISICCCTPHRSQMLSWAHQQSVFAVAATNKQGTGQRTVQSETLCACHTSTANIKRPRGLQKACPKSPYLS